MTYFTQSIKALAVTVALMLPSLAFAAEPAKVSENGVLTDQKGMTLYTFEKDKDNKSMCNDKCAVNWPPFKAEGDAKDMDEWTVITRDDGSKQWAYDDDPLYTYIEDKVPGDEKGKDKGGVWKVAKPD